MAARAAQEETEAKKADVVGLGTIALRRSRDRRSWSFCIRAPPSQRMKSLLSHML
jgi:hypothetical protein